MWHQWAHLLKVCSHTSPWIKSCITVWGRCWTLHRETAASELWERPSPSSWWILLLSFCLASIAPAMSQLTELASPRRGHTLPPFFLRSPSPLCLSLWLSLSLVPSVVLSRADPLIITCSSCPSLCPALQLLIQSLFLCLSVPPSPCLSIYLVSVLFGSVPEITVLCYYLNDTIYKSRSLELAIVSSSVWLSLFLSLSLSLSLYLTSQFPLLCNHYFSLTLTSSSLSSSSLSQA